MSNNDPNHLREQARCFVRQHLGQCVAELVEWKETALLRQGRLRELADLCGWAAPDNMSVAEFLVVKAALDHTSRVLVKVPTAQELELQQVDAQRATAEFLQRIEGYVPFELSQQVQERARSIQDAIASSVLASSRIRGAQNALTRMLEMLDPYIPSDRAAYMKQLVRAAHQSLGDLHGMVLATEPDTSDSPTAPRPRSIRP